MTIFLGLGTNLGERTDNIKRALQYVEQIGTIHIISPWYETEPFGVIDQPWFFNLVVRLETEQSIEDVFFAIKEIEKNMGRKETERYGPRIIDIDILLCEDQSIQTDVLQVPHARMHERLTVLVPLADIAPNVVHPILKKTIVELLEECSDTGIVRLLPS